MSGRSPSRSDNSSVQRRQEQQSQLPFTGSNVLDDEIAGSGIPPSSPRPARTTYKHIRSNSMSSGVLSSSYGQRVPVRSFVHQTTHGSHEPVQYSSEGVREQTQQLASWTIGSLHSSTPSMRPGHAASEPDTGRPTGLAAWSDYDSNELVSVDSQTIEEVSEPASPEDQSPVLEPSSSSSLLSRMIRRAPSKGGFRRGSAESRRSLRSERRPGPEVVITDADNEGPEESTPLLRKQSPSDSGSKQSYGSSKGVIEQWQQQVAPWDRLRARSKAFLTTLVHPKRWDRQVVFRAAIVEPVYTLPAVFLGWLLNILDALSYGMILFPLGNEIFADTGPDGISMFFVSCIVSQLVYSLGGSIFKGAVGSEMIEVVPFFHKMTEMIMNNMEGASPAAVRATTITSYALSSIITGLIFLALGFFKLGSLMSFFPRSILSGCIGGVGIFLFITGIEVSARMDTGLEYTWATVQKLFASDTVMLWITPLFLAVVLIIVRRFFNHPVVLPAYFISVTVLFYIVAVAVPWLDLDKLRDSGWIFEKPSSGKPFYNFYTFYDFRIVDWSALASTIPTMFALSFFGIIHVPINVPALGLAVQEDDVDANRELIAHGISNTLSGCFGSIQNYLVYANSIMFYENGGDNRLAGFLLAVVTTLTWFAGPGAIGYIPVMIVGILIYLLGIDLIKESLWDTAGRVHKLEFLMIVAIALVMGLYDFVVGIVAGIVLACLLYVLQSSKVSAIRATYSGSIAESTVRRHPMQRKFLRQVGSQILVVKLAGYLFFGTIVAVENKARGIVDEEAFKRQPIRYLILDFTHVDGIDFSAAEGFSRMHRILQRRDVRMCLSGVSKTGDLGRSLTMVGLLDEENVDDDLPPPKVYEDLNKGLEACENELLLAFKRRGETVEEANEGHGNRDAHAAPLPAASTPAANASIMDAMHSSPRRNFVQQAVQTTLSEYDITSLNKFNHFKQPLPLILQSFYEHTDKDIDFWHRAVPYLSRREYTKGTVLYSRGDEPNGFYLVESGLLRADYHLEQGHYYESIVAGTTCGELPFFSDSERSATVVAEVDCVVWLLTSEKWRELEREWPEGCREFLKVGLKLTSERMNAVTSYVLVMAG